MNVLLVEDDPLQAEAILDQLKESFPASRTLHVTTEREFRERLTEVADFAPNVAIIDVMLRWADPGPDVEQSVPEEVRREKHYRAGLRCQRLLSEKLGPKSPPVIIYTVLERTDLNKLPEAVEYLPKGGDLNPLIQKLHQM